MSDASLPLLYKNGKFEQQHIMYHYKGETYLNILRRATVLAQLPLC